MSDTSARASRFAFALGSFARNGLIGARAGVAPPPAGVAERGVGVDVGVTALAGVTCRGVDVTVVGADAGAGVARTAGPEKGGVTGRTGVAEKGREGLGGADEGAAAVEKGGGDWRAGVAAGDIGAEGFLASGDAAIGPRGAKGAGGAGAFEGAGRDAGAADGAGRMNGGAAGRGGAVPAAGAPCSDEVEAVGATGAGAAGAAGGRTGDGLGADTCGVAGTPVEPSAGVSLGTTSVCGGGADGATGACAVVGAAGAAAIAPCGSAAGPVATVAGAEGAEDG